MAMNRNHRCDLVGLITVSSLSYLLVRIVPALPCFQ